MTAYQSLAALASLLASLWPGLPAAADVVSLKDGSEQRGRVSDLGGNSLEVHLRAGTSHRVYLRDVKKIAFEVSKEPAAPREDVVFRKNGTDLKGTVTVSADGKSVVVSRADGASVNIPRDDVLRIVYRDQAGGETVPFYSERIRDEVQASIAALDAAPEAAKAAEEKLKDFGVFAIDKVEEARSAAKAGSPAQKALDRVIRLYRLREITPDALQDLADYYRIIDSGTVEEKRGLLEEMFTRYVDESVPVAKFLVRDLAEDSQVRGWAIDLLGRMQLNRDLVEIFNDPAGGQVQLAAAIALARNRLLAGAPALIEALEMDRPEVRELAIRTLKDAVGKDFGFGVHDTPSSRKDSVRRWKSWWEENRATVQAQTASILSGRYRPGETPERRKALGLWKQGCESWDAKKLPSAENALRAAVRADPTFFNAQVSLGVFLYLNRDKGEEGRGILLNLLQRRLPEMGPGDMAWIHYYLGHAFEMAADLERAETEYREALGIDSRFFRAAAALGDLKFRAAIGKDSRPEDRRNQLREAETQYRKAIELVEAYNAGLETLSISDLPVENAPAFERLEHNRTILEVKTSLRKLKAEMHFGLAKIRSLLDDNRRAVAELTSAIEAMGDDRQGGARELLVSLHNYRAFLLEGAGETLEALKEYRTVIRDDLDPKDATALEGIRRLRAKMGPSRKARAAAPPVRAERK